MMLIKSRILAKDNRSRRGKNGTHARLKRISYPNIIDSKLKGFKGDSRRNIRLKIFERYRSIVEIIREESEVGAARLLPPMEISLEDTRGDTRYTRRVEVILPYTDSRGEIVEETQRQRPFLLLAEATHDDLDRARETSSLEVASDRLRSRVDNEYRYIYIYKYTRRFSTSHGRSTKKKRNNFHSYRIVHCTRENLEERRNSYRNSTILYDLDFFFFFLFFHISSFGVTERYDEQYGVLSRNVRHG